MTLARARNQSRGRDIHEAHRVSTPLELLFDLTFVVAIAQAAVQLHHGISSEPLGTAVLHYTMAFSAIWWAWMNYTWFASAYDNDDAWFRILTMLQMVGVLIFATGIPLIFKGDFSYGVLGYAVMRFALVAQWLRAAKGDPERSEACKRYALGIFLVQLLWISRLFIPMQWQMLTYVLFFAAELMVPVWAEQKAKTPWHAHHISERYGLFTIIVLGECVLGATNAVGSVLQASGYSWEVGLVGIGSVALIMSMWWLYFLIPSGQSLHVNRERSYVWGYSHFAIFASVAACGAGLEVVADLLKTAAPMVDTPIAEAHGAAVQHAVSPVKAIGFLAGALAIYMCSMGWVWWYVTRVKGKYLVRLLLALTWLGLVVVAVAAGVPISWAMPALAVAPAIIISLERTDLKENQR